MEKSEVYNKSQSSVKLIKTAKTYNWEIKVYGDDMKKIDDEVKEEDKRLKAEFLE